MFPKYSCSYQCCILYRQIRITASTQKFDKIFYNLGNAKIIEVFTIFSNLFPYIKLHQIFAASNLTVSSSLQKFSTILFTLDPFSANLSLRTMMFEITTPFVVDLRLFASSIAFSAFVSGDSSIIGLFAVQFIITRSGWLLTVGIA